MNPILVPFLSCRRNWSFPVRCFLIVTGSVLLLAAGNAGAVDAATGWNPGAGATAGD